MQYVQMLIKGDFVMVLTLFASFLLGDTGIGAEVTKTMQKDVMPLFNSHYSDSYVGMQIY